MDFQREEVSNALTIEQMEGYIICMKDAVKRLQESIKTYEDALKWRNKFRKT